MRIDRLLCELNIGSRSQVKELLKAGQVTVDGIIVKKADTQVDERKVYIQYRGKEYRYQPFVYFLMNKPAGVITATRDEKEKTVLDLFKEQYQQMHRGELPGIPVQDIFPVGRLDKDTVGLLLLTPDGGLAHDLLSPKKHVEKRYYVRTDKVLSERMLEQLEKGVDIGEKELTLPSKVEKESQNTCFITITEGKYHQVKRMFAAVGLQVTYLKRISMGGLTLDDELKEGQIRELTEEEVNELYA